MQRIGNQPNAKYQFDNNGCTSRQKAEIQAKEMVTVDINLETIHVEDLQDGRDDEHKAQQDLQDRFADRTRRIQGLRFIVMVIVAAAKQIIPPMAFFTSDLLFGDLGADHLPPAHDFLRLVGT